ncbi:MAG TPA: TIGR03620 family F420-dependent LLM class oxidoreductase [Sneathiellales bacterium]|nr:TIGR03620 family F420-dependent LLM class oxidoreductase [Sneathiellales bacterium]
MKLGKYGVFTFTDVMAPDELANLARRVEELGYSTLWYPEAFNYETMALGGYLLQHSEKLIVASGIANIYARDAAASVMGHNTLNGLYDKRFILGLGVSHSPLVADVRGHEYSRKPVSTMRAYLDAMDQAWEAFGGAPAVKQVMLAALGPNMLKLSGERTLGALPYNVTPEHAGIARQQVGADNFVCTEQKICLTTNGDEARAAARDAMTPYLPLPNYFKNWFRLGFDESDLENGGSDRLMDAMVIWGNTDDIQAKLQAHFDSGAGQVVIQPIRPDGQPGPDWNALEALAPEA